MSEFMIKVYVNLVRNNKKTLDEVPEDIRDQVEALL